MAIKTKKRQELCIEIEGITRHTEKQFYFVANYAQNFDRVEVLPK